MRSVRKHGVAYHSGEQSSRRHATDATNDGFDRFGSTQVAVVVLAVGHLAATATQRVTVMLHVDRTSR